MEGSLPGTFIAEFEGQGDREERRGGEGMEGEERAGEGKGRKEKGKGKAVRVFVTFCCLEPRSCAC